MAHAYVIRKLTRALDWCPDFNLKLCHLCNLLKVAPYRCRCCARLTRRFFKARAIARFRNLFARVQKAIWTHLNALVACLTTCALRTYFFLMFTWDLPHNEIRPVWLRLSCWIETRNSCTGPSLYRSCKWRQISDQIQKFHAWNNKQGRDVCVVIPS